MKPKYALRRCALATLAFTLTIATTSSAQTSFSAGASGAGFGGTSAVGDGEIFVGSAPIGWQTGNEPPGTVYRYVRADDKWLEADRIKASDGRIGDHFGRSIFLHGDILVVGAPGVGAAYVFSNSAGSWVQTGKLTPSSLSGDAEFGGAYARAGFRIGNIAVAGDRIAVTAVGSETHVNAVHVFRKDGSDWIEESVLRIADGESEEEMGGFAHTIAGADKTIFVGASSADGGKGAVLVFTLENDGWTRTGRLSTDDLTDRSSLGQSLAFQNGRLYAGAPRLGSGAVVVFEKDGNGNWAETSRIVQPKPEEGERNRPGFGSIVAASRDLLLVGARGSAFVVAADGTTEILAQLTPPDDRSRSGFGFGLAIGNDVAVVGSPSADYEEGIATVFERDSESGQWKTASTLASEIAFLASISGEQVDCEDGTAEMFGCENVDLVAFMSSSELTSDRGVKMTDIWGWEDPETGKEWVLLGRTDGTAFIDISDPSNPVYVGQLFRTEGSPGSAWRDVKVYKNHAYIVADGAEQHGTQIFDLTQLRDVDPADMPVTLEETAHYSGTASTHNIVINEETGFAYAVGNRSGGNTCGGQLHIFDIREPANPKFAGCYSASGRGTHDAQCVIYRGADAKYAGREICFASNGSSFVIADVTDKDSTRTVSDTSYPNQAYTHQGWLTGDHRYFYMNDELDELNNLVDGTRTLIWDLADLEDPQLVGQYIHDSGASDHNLYVRDNFMYQSNYQAGLRILDISDPLNPVPAGHFDTAPFAEDAPGFGGSWSNYPYFKSGVIAVSSRAEGLFLVKKRTVDS